MSIALLVGLAVFPSTARADVTLIPDTVGSRDVVYDEARSLLYISRGQYIYRHDPATGVSLAPVMVGIDLMGMDLDASGDHLLVADRVGAGVTGAVRRVDLDDWSVESLSYPLEPGELGGFAVAAGYDDSIVVSGLYSGSGWIPLRRRDPETGTWSTLQVSPAKSYSGAMLKASADRRTICIAEANNSWGIYGYYKPATGQLSMQGMSRFLYEITANADGTRMVVPSYQGLAMLDSGFAEVADIPEMGVYLNSIYSPDGDTLYAATVYGVDVIHPATGELLAEIGCPGLQWVGNQAMQIGRMAITPDASRLFITTLDGVYVRSVDGIAEPGVQRIAGADRYLTAIANSKMAYRGGADAVVIATGTNWPDALGGSALAGALDGPLLLTTTSDLPDAVAAEIRRLGATKAYVLGGPGAVGPGVEVELKSMLG
ncbi:MAG: cell wall-binding repeat-containing protein, partial [Actinomycetota bacterium]|nr:cell wall-binding repeat-containing protein [Actinomycetota bacterium]